MAEWCELDKQEQQSLTRRYLLWLYKTTKDEIDKIDRKLTQLSVDQELQGTLVRQASSLDTGDAKGVEPFLGEWEQYIETKKKESRRSRYQENGRLESRYLFLRMKFKGIKKIVIARLGQKGWDEFSRLYEEACVRRILEDATGHR